MPEKLVVASIPVSSAFREKTPLAEARTALALPVNETIFLLMTGNMGYGDVAEIVAHLRPCLQPEDRALVMVGNNARLSTLLAERFGVDARVLRVPLHPTRISVYGCKGFTIIRLQTSPCKPRKHRSRLTHRGKRDTLTSDDDPH